ncbi:hypothetical protein BDQ17DRAFT_1324012 [Cyathus striatus]|nr:hypothetical protein BDQ17DRAFT_1324012 [Cyathus striatus]
MNMDLLYDYGGTDSPDLVNSDWQLPPYEMPPIDLPHYYTLVFHRSIMSAGDFLRQKLSLPAHSEVNLNSLPDPPPGKRPSQSLPFLVMLAIHGSPRKMLTLQEIYKAIEYRFEWYRRPKSREDERAWKSLGFHSTLPFTMESLSPQAKARNGVR